MAKKQEKRVIEAALKSDDAAYIGRMAEGYYYGRGHEKSIKTALRLWERACALGDGNALYYYGVCQFYGDGVERDKEKAFCLWEKAAAQGHEAARVSLAALRPSSGERNIS